MATNVNCTAATRFTRPGRAISPRWGKFQAYLLDKAELATAAAGAGILAPDELALILWALEENDGYLSLADIQRGGGLSDDAGAGTGARARMRVRGRDEGARDR